MAIVENVNGDITTSRLVADTLSLAYDDRLIVEGLSLEVPTGRITVIVGANACGKSTLLRGLARLMKPKGGARAARRRADRTGRRRARSRPSSASFPSSRSRPTGLSVDDLVSRGRHPHQRWFRQWSAEDEAAVAWALDRPT